MVERHKLTFDILSDPGNRYAGALGIRFDLPADLKAVYQSIGLDLAGHNGDESWSLPIPGRVVADAGGLVRASEFDVDYTRRPEPETVLEDLRRLG